jgi:hypothetical protein
MSMLVIPLARLRWRRAFCIRRRTSARQLSIIDAAVPTVPDPNVAAATNLVRSYSHPGPDLPSPPCLMVSGPRLLPLT